MDPSAAASSHFEATSPGAGKRIGFGSKTRIASCQRAMKAMKARIPGPRLRSSRSPQDFCRLAGRRPGADAAGAGDEVAVAVMSDTACRSVVADVAGGSRSAGRSHLRLGALGVLGGQQLPDPLPQRLELGQLAARAAAGPGEVDL